MTYRDIVDINILDAGDLLEIDDMTYGDADMLIW